MANCICFELRPRTDVGWDTTVLSPIRRGSHKSVRVPHVRTSVRGPKTTGEAQPQLLSSDPLLCPTQAKRLADLRGKSSTELRLVETPKKITMLPRQSDCSMETSF